MAFPSNLLVSSFACCILSVPKAGAIDLRPGTPIERDLAGGETHVYEVGLAADQYLHAVAEQRGIDIKLTAFAPDGKELIAIDNLTALVGLEPISLLTGTAGTYRLQVSAVNKGAVKGQYQIRINEIRRGTEEDSARIEAQTTFIEGRTLEAQGNAGKSLERFQNALELWQALGDTWYQAIILNEIGAVGTEAGKPQLAMERLQQALTLWQKLSDVRGQAEAFGSIGSAYASMGDPHRALEYHNQALPLMRMAGSTLR